MKSFMLWHLALMALIVSSNSALASGQTFTVTDLDPHGIMFSGQAQAINKDGTAIGVGLIGNTMVGFSWTKEQGIRLISTPQDFLPRDINKDGTLTGFIRSAANPQLMLGVIVRSDGTLIQLGSLGGLQTNPQAINDREEVTGVATTATGEDHAFYWSQSTGMIDINLSPSGQSSVAYDINNHGEVVGYFFDPTTGGGKAFIWSLEIGGTPLPATDPAFGSVAYAINDRGDIAGGRVTSETGCSRPFVLTRKGVVHEFPLHPPLPDTSCPLTGGAVSINEHGIVGGWIDLTGPPASSEVFRWDLKDKGSVSVLPQLGVAGSSVASPSGVAPDGSVVGLSHSSSATSRPVLWGISK